MNSQETRPVYGIHFCNSCKNILQPIRSNDSVLEFHCRNCKKIEKDFTSLRDEEKLVYSRTAEATVQDKSLDKEFVLDPTMPRVTIDCPECGWEQAIYFLSPAKGETNIKVSLMCTGNKIFDCGHEWELDPNTPMPRPAQPYI